MAKKTDKEKLEAIAKDLQEKCQEVDKKYLLIQERGGEFREFVNSKFKIQKKGELWKYVFESIQDIFREYELTMGTTQGCDEFVTKIIESGMFLNSSTDNMPVPEDGKSGSDMSWFNPDNKDSLNTWWDNLDEQVKQRVEEQVKKGDTTLLSKL
jgi:hypothetical protein